MAAVKRKKQTAKTNQTSLRHLWLASLGLAAVARRQALGAAGRAGSLRARLRGAVLDAGSNVRGGIENVREQVEPKVVKFSAEVEARLAPVLDKLGLKAGQRRKARKGRKPAPRKPAARTQAARKPAARKPAARRARRA